MILSGSDIKTYVHNGRIQIEPFFEEHVKSASYTFTLGSKLLRLVDNQTVRLGSKAQYEELLIPEEGYTLQPQEFVLGFTRERLKLNGMCGCLLSARGSCAQMGLNVLLSSIFAEPDTDNVQILEIVNNANIPIVLVYNMPIIKGIFMPLEKK